MDKVAVSRQRGWQAVLSVLANRNFVPLWIGDGLYFLQATKRLFVSALHPQHFCLDEANVDPLPFTFVSFRKAVQTLEDRGAVA